MVKVITYGTYDLFHEGHYRLLQRAKALGDYLIVGVTTESFDEARGKLNVVDSLMTRIENVKKTGFADEVIVEDHVGQKVEDIQKYGIDIFIDDSYRNCKLIKDGIGIPVLLFTTRYNIKEKDESLIRVSNWYEIYNYLKSIQEEKL